MGEGLKSFIGRLSRHAMQSSANPSAKATPITVTEAPAKPEEKAGEEVQVPLGTGNAELKMESARCDLHPLYRLRAAVISVPSGPGADFNKVDALHCTRAACNRHYTPELGYFNLADAMPPDLGDAEGKLHCASKHRARYMVVSKSSEHFLWVCPEAGCLAAVPYQEP